MLRCTGRRPKDGRRWFGTRGWKSRPDGRTSKDVPLIEEITGLISQWPTRGNFHNIVQRLVEKRRQEFIVETFAVILRNGRFRPNERDFTSGISACGRAKLWQQACWLFDTMLENKAVADSVSYNATISAFEKGGQWQKALGLFEAMPKSRVSVDVVSYSATISACEKVGKWQQALDLFEAMHKAPQMFSATVQLSVPVRRVVNGSRH